MDKIRESIGWKKEYIDSSIIFPYRVAILDTGINAHPDLINSVIYFKDWIHLRELPYDDNGHGTHVAGCIAGNGNLSNGKYSGICPGVELIIHKILDQNGNGNIAHLKKCLYWILENYKQYRIKIVNISISMQSSLINKDFHCIIKLMELLWNAGVIIVCAAGNGGPDYGTINGMADCEWVITVGCYETYKKDFRMLCQRYSSRGLPGAEYVKPDLVAPGAYVMSCNAFFRKNHRGYYNAYVRRGGTSMSAPIVSGAIMLLIIKKDLHTGRDIKAELIRNCIDLHCDKYLQGNGCLYFSTLN